MSFGQAISTCFSKYATFSGRASRSEFWWFYLFNVLVVSVPYAIGLSFLANSASSSNYDDPSDIVGFVMMGIVGVIGLVLLLPNLAVAARRLHDRSQSAWLLLLNLVPCASIVLIVFYLLPSTPGPNQYGEPAEAIR